jgi:hypothetical protein
MPELKLITQGGVAAALQKAERYRLLNDSAAAESICLDVLAVDPENQSAIVMLVLSLTDQFQTAGPETTHRAHELVSRIADPYKRAYYAGITYERRAKAQLNRNIRGGADIAMDWYRQAMQCYAHAEGIRPQGNDEAILRWNSCARMLAKHDTGGTATEEYEPVLED